MILYERFAAIQLVKIPLEAIFVNAILDFLTPKKMETAWTWTSVKKMINFALVASASIRTGHIIVNVHQVSGTTADDVLMLTSAKFKMEIVKNSASIQRVGFLES